MDFTRLDLSQNLHTYAVALITWLGVLFYLVRLEKMTLQLEREVERATHRQEPK
jgi:CcmD family protein